MVCKNILFFAFVLTAATYAVPVIEQKNKDNMSSYEDAIVVEADYEADESESQFEEEGRELKDCLLEVEPGPCKATIPAWHYDTSSGECKDFFYSGCGGNENKFSRKEQCESVCQLVKKSKDSSCAEPAPECNDECELVAGKDGCLECSCPTKDPSECNLPPVRGYCRAYFTRWYFDSETKKCREFTFGGCEGNGNNFESEDDCLTLCGGVENETS